MIEDSRRFPSQSLAFFAENRAPFILSETGPGGDFFQSRLHVAPPWRRGKSTEALSAHLPIAQCAGVGICST